MKNYKKRKRKMYYYLPTNAPGVEKAREEFGDGRFDVPNKHGLNAFLDDIWRKGGRIKPLSIVIDEGKGFLELQTEEKYHEKSFNALTNHLGALFVERIEILKKRKNVKTFTK